MEALFKSDDGVLYRANMEEVDYKRFAEALGRFNDETKPPFTRVPKKATGMPCDLFVREGEAMAYITQDYISINTKWTPWKKVNEQGQEVVFFEPTFNQGLVEQKVDFHLESPLYLIGHQTSNDTKFYAIFIEGKKSKLATYYLALPNMFSTGKVCLGNENIVDGNNLFQKLQSSVKIFNESVYHNTDLWGNNGEYKKKLDLVSSWFVDPNFKPINNPSLGRVKFVNEGIQEIVRSIRLSEEV